MVCLHLASTLHMYLEVHFLACSIIGPNLDRQIFILIAMNKYAICMVCLHDGALVH